MTTDGLSDYHGDPEGKSASLQHSNLPGNTTLSYRVGTRTTSLNRMLACLYNQTSSQGKRPLAALNPEKRDDPAIAFLDAWATVIDVLSFYQERIANEGYLRTATEHLSVLELTRPLGYKLSPGVAASTFLVFTVEENPNASEAIVIPEGTQVQSIPGQGQLPQTFETIEKIEAKAEWNVLKPDAPKIKQVQKVCWNTIELNLKGSDTQLQPGDQILLFDAEAQPPSQFGCFTLQTVEPNSKAGYTQVNWKQDSEKQPGPSELNQPQLFAFRDRITLFGHNAPDWNEMSEDIKRKYSPDLGGIFCLSKQEDGTWEKIWKPIYGVLKNADIRALVNLDGMIFAGTHQGIFRSTDEGQQWMPMNKGLTNTDIHSLIANKSGYLFAGATGGHVFRSIDAGENWVAIATGSITMIEPKLRDVPPPQKGKFKRIFNRKNTKRKSWDVLTTSLPNTVIYSLAIAGNYLFAGTDRGIFRTTTTETNWIPVNQVSSNADAIANLMSVAVYSFAHYLGTNSNQYYLFAGTNRGIFRSQDNGENWISVNQVSSNADAIADLTNAVIYSLTQYQNTDPTTSYLFAGTNQGVFRSEDHGNTWIAINQGLPIAEPRTDLTRIVSSLVTPENQTHLIVATSTGVFCSEDHGENWTEVTAKKNQNSANQAIRCLMVTSRGNILLGTAFTGLNATEWPGFTLQDSYIDLDTTYSKILPDSWVVLSNPSHQQLYKVTKVTTVSRNDFLQAAQLTRLELETKENLNEFGGKNLRGTIVLAQSEQLELFEERVTQNSSLKSLAEDKKTIELDRIVQGLEGKKIMVSGKLMRGRFKGSEGSLISLDGSRSQSIAPKESLIVIATPKPNANKSDLVEIWVLKNKWGFCGELEVNPGEILLETADEGDEIVSEKAQVASASHTGECTTLTLCEPLENTYDRLTVTINANVALATHGETVTDEVLGSGDGMIANQQFVLKNPPLTYIPASTPSGKQSTLKVLVNDVLWHEAPSFYGLGPNSRSYVLQTDLDGNTLVMFGNGYNGARLPTGEENIRATYRSGIGLDGEVVAGSIAILQTAPLGIQEVTNPLPATGAAPPESLRQIREKAPLSVTASQHIISLQDLKDFAYSFPGIGKAQATVLEAGGSQNVHLTIAAANGGLIAKNSELYLNLVKGIEALCPPSQRLEMVSKVKIDNCDRQFFKLEAQIKVARDCKAIQVLAEVRTALLAAFSFERREFGQAVRAADIAAIVHSVRGVLALKIVRLDFMSGSQSFNLKAQIKVATDCKASQVLAEIRTALVAAFAFERREFGQAVTAEEIKAIVHSLRGVRTLKIVRLDFMGGSRQFTPVLEALPARWKNSKVLPPQILLLNPDDLVLQEMK